MTTPLGHRTGRLSDGGQHTRRTMLGAVRTAAALDTLGPAPVASRDWASPVEIARGGNSWNMFGNDIHSDCTAADAMHRIMAVSAARGQIVIPTDADALAVYAATTSPPFDPSTGANDAGAYEPVVCTYMQQVGVLGFKSLSWGTIDPTNLEHIKWAAHLMCGVRLGIDLCEATEQQFEADQPLTYVPGSPLVGGHDVYLTNYVAEGPYIVTWGKRVPATWEWLQHCLDEAHWELYEGASDPGDTIDQMLAIGLELDQR